MNIDVTVITALIAAIAAIMSPTINTLINRLADIRLKKLDIFQSTKQKAYDDFAESFSILYHSTIMEGEEPIRKILAATYKMMAYSKSQTRQLLKEFSKNIEKGHWDSPDEFDALHEQFFSCIDAIKKELYKLK